MRKIIGLCLLCGLPWLLAAQRNITDVSTSLDGTRKILRIETADGGRLYECRAVAANRFDTLEIATLTQWAAGSRLITPSISCDGRTLLFASDKKLPDKFDLYSARFSAGAWQTPEPFPAAINTPESEESPSLAGNGRILYFIRRTPPEGRNAKEKTELFRALQNEHGEWSKVEAIVPPINDEQELTPHILADNKTLFFASKRPLDGKKSKGTAIYCARTLVGKEWYQPTLICGIEERNFVNPDYDYRTDKLTVTEIKTVKKQLIYSQIDVPTSEHTLPMCVTAGVVVDKARQPLADASIEIVDDITSQLFMRANTDDDGKFIVPLPKGKRYRLDFTKNGYSHHYKTVDASDLTETVWTNDTIGLFDRLELQFNLFDSEMFEPLKQPVVTLKNLSDAQQTVLENAAVAQGRYIVALPLGKVYELTFAQPNFVPFNFLIDTEKSVQFSESEIDVALQPDKSALAFAVVSQTDERPVAARVVFQNLSRKERYEIATDSTTQTHEISLRMGELYRIAVQGKGHFAYETQIDVPSEKSFQRTFALQPILENQSISLSNILFETASAELMSRSFAPLDELVEFMRLNPTVQIELSAHTDNVGNDAYNQRLSERRAQSTADYLVSQGIDSQRIISVGYGKTKPIAPNDTEENRSKNRRVEMKIVKIN